MPHLTGVVNGPGCGECPFVTSAVCFIEVGLLVQLVVLVAALWQPQGIDELGGEETLSPMARSRWWKVSQFVIKTIKSSPDFLLKFRHFRKVWWAFPESLFPNHSVSQSLIT